MRPPSKTETDNRITGVRFDEQNLWLTLADGRSFSEPIKRHIRLEKATPEQRLQWELTDEDRGLNWPALWKPSDTGMVSVWDIEQDQLYNQALCTLQVVKWDTTLITPAQHELVALWRMEADINNGGFMQFLCNWGAPNLEVALQALQKLGATQAHECLQQMFAVIARFEDSPDVTSLDDLPALLTEAENDRLQELDEAFWDYPDHLPKLVVQHYGPAA